MGVKDTSSICCKLSPLDLPWCMWESQLDLCVCLCGTAGHILKAWQDLFLNLRRWSLYESQCFVAGPCGSRWKAAWKRRDRRWKESDHLAQTCMPRHWLICLSCAVTVKSEVLEVLEVVGAGCWGHLACHGGLMTHNEGLCACRVHLVGEVYGHTGRCTHVGTHKL